MEQVIDKLISELEELRQTDEFFQALEVDTETKFDDPGVVMVDEYPYMFVAPVEETPLSETMGIAGYDVRQLSIQIGIVINMSDYFDASVNEVAGTRELIRSASLVRKLLRRLRKRKLDDLSGIRNVVVQSTNYVPDVRGGAFIKAALISVIVERQYTNEE